MPAPAPILYLVGPKLISLLYIQKPTIVECRGSWLINFIISFTIANCVNRSTCRESLAFKQNTSYAIDLYFDFYNIGVNKLNARNILT